MSGDNGDVKKPAGAIDPSIIGDPDGFKFAGDLAGIFGKGTGVMFLFDEFAGADPDRLRKIFEILDQGITDILAHEVGHETPAGARDPSAVLSDAGLSEGTRARFNGVIILGVPKLKPDGPA